MEEEKKEFWKHIDTTEKDDLVTVTKAANVPGGILVHVTTAAMLEVKKTEEEETVDQVQISQNTVFVPGAEVKETENGFVIGRL